MSYVVSDFNDSPDKMTWWIEDSQEVEESQEKDQVANGHKGSDSVAINVH